MADFVIKRGDTRPALAATLTDNGVAIDLTTATSVKFLMRLQGQGTITVQAAMAFVNRAAGQVSYQWITADTSGAGTYEIEFEITWNDSTKETVPNDNPTGSSVPYYTVQVVADIG